MDNYQGLRMRLGGEPHSIILPEDATVKEAREHYQSLVEAAKQSDPHNRLETAWLVIMHARSMLWLINQMEDDDDQ